MVPWNHSGKLVAGNEWLRSALPRPTSLIKWGSGGRALCFMILRGGQVCLLNKADGRGQARAWRSEHINWITKLLQNVGTITEPSEPESNPRNTTLSPNQKEKGSTCHQRTEILLRWMTSASQCTRDGYALHRKTYHPLWPTSADDLRMTLSKPCLHKGNINVSKSASKQLTVQAVMQIVQGNSATGIFATEV